MSLRVFKSAPLRTGSN